METWLNGLHAWISGLGLSAERVELASLAVNLGVLLVLAFVANFIAKQLILRGVAATVRRTPVKWDDALLEAHFFSRLSHLAPAMVINAFGSQVLGATPEVLAVVNAVVNIYLTVIWVIVFFAFLDGLHLLARRSGRADRTPIKGFVQAFKLVAAVVALILVLATILNKSPVYILGGMGALTAVLLLVFKDAILGFVAGIMISVNEMVRMGDWIEMPKAGADGDVIDVSLTTVKVQNWDKTITTIPSYDLISGSFKNWRGMFESGGRRIKRALYIDMHSVRFADEAMIEQWRRIDLLKGYLDEKQAEIDRDNSQRGTDLTILGNGRRITNFGTFRAYCVAYLRQHPRINQGMTMLVRQLSPGEHGIPLELYVFTNDTRWAVYEDIQADIFDHLLAVIDQFQLSVFQQPSGGDLQSAVRQLVGGGSSSGGSAERIASPRAAALHAAAQRSEVLGGPRAGATLRADSEAELEPRDAK
ncbi:mechanosensitive ion channel family protein [Cephaloticoccus primus]|uniref:mechanosensitive ion channel family protein n=1 Tax=Cephaloticoccus primus TaxID=1548207 RepID=UPI0009EDE8C1|nr:mechanosensitive ion channel domain-containing protein [Cephaloticoccus primus]